MRGLRIVPTEEPAIHVIVEDIADPLLAAEVRAQILAVFREVNVRPGAWVVAVVASETRGRWDVGIRGPKGSHFVSFAALPAQIAPVAAAHVRRTLRQLSPQDVSD
jgi:hypothetical protein